MTTTAKTSARRAPKIEPTPLADPPNNSQPYVLESTKVKQQQEKWRRDAMRQVLLLDQEMESLGHSFDDEVAVLRSTLNAEIEARVARREDPMNTINLCGGPPTEAEGVPVEPPTLAIAHQPAELSSLAS